MAQKIFGDLEVKRSIFGEVRTDRGLRAVTITADETLNLNSYSWQKIKNVTSALDVNLPDATTLKAGWSVVIENDATSTFNLVVVDAGTNTIRTLTPGEAVEFTVQSIAAAAGVWHLTKREDAGSVPASRYTTDFNATTDWGTASGGEYTITILGSAHTRGLNPSVTVFETVGAVESKVSLDISYDNTTGDISLVIPEHPDMRFAGRVLII